MITGVRTIELRAALWSEFDLDNASCRNDKNARLHLVPLSTQALDLLNELKVMTGNYRYVFLGRNDPNKPMSEVSINQLINRISYGGRLAGHGFRHTFSTVLHEAGFNSIWIELQLAHVDNNSIRRIYNHANYLESRIDMMQWYSNKINQKN